MSKKKSVKERRRNKRARSSEISLTIEGETYPTQNLSIGGTLISGYQGPLSAGALLEISEIKPSGVKPMAVEIKARVSRAGPEAGDLALAFLDLDSPAYEILLDIMAKKVEGLEPPESTAPEEPLDLPEEPDAPRDQS